MTRVTILVCLLIGTAAPAASRVMSPYRWASPPMPVEAGQEFSMCAANVGVSAADLEMQFINARTGAILAEKEIKLPPPGATGTFPDPCLKITAAAIPTTNTEPPLLVGLVFSRRVVFARAAAATASIQVTQTAASGVQKLLMVVPLTLATRTNGGNTPIETIK